MKKKKKNAPEPVEPQLQDYKRLPHDILIEMLIKRTSEEDCNAGCIFDSLESEYWSDTKACMQVIFDALLFQNVQVVMFKFSKENKQPISQPEDALPDEAVSQAPSEQKFEE